MTQTYHSSLQTGSGRTRVLLTFAGESATIDYDSNWMGSGPIRYRFRCQHQRRSATYGLLKLTTIERYETLLYTVIEDLADYVTLGEEFDEEYRQSHRNFSREVVYEYIKLPSSEVWIAGDPGLEDMQALGYADWPERFDFILFLHFSVAMAERYLEGTNLGLVLSALDKMKFALATEGE